MTEILKVAQLTKNDCVPEMDVGTRRINAELDAQWAPQRKLFAQLRLANDLSGAFF